MTLIVPIQKKVEAGRIGKPRLGMVLYKGIFYDERIGSFHSCLKKKNPG
jgi:hypothetical protein